MIEEIVQLAVEEIRYGLRHGVDLRTDAASKFGVPQVRHDLNFFDTFDALRDQRDEALAANPHVFVVIVRTIDGEIVGPGALTVDRKLSRGPDSRANARACDAF